MATPSVEADALEKQLREKALQSLSRRKEQRDWQEIDALSNLLM